MELKTTRDIISFIREKNAQYRYVRFIKDGVVWRVMGAMGDYFSLSCRGDMRTVDSDYLLAIGDIEIIESVKEGGNLKNQYES